MLIPPSRRFAFLTRSLVTRSLVTRSLVTRSLVTRSFLASTLAASALVCLSPAQAATVELSAEASRPVANDLAFASVFTEDTQPAAADASARVNERIAKAIALAKGKSGVKVQSGGVQSMPVYGKTRRIEGWRIRAGLRLESSDPLALSELVGRLQQLDLLPENLALMPAKASRDATEKQLVVEAIETFKARAQIVADTLGKPYRIKSLNIQTQGSSPIPRPMVMMSARSGMADGGALPIEAGETPITVQVFGQIEIAE